MLHILHGEDDFSIREALEKIKEELGGQDLVASNTTTLQGQNLTPQQLAATCDTVPFLAPKRLVVVEGLLSRFEPRDRGTRSPAPEARGWQSLKGYVGRLPESTELVLVDGKLSKANPLLKGLAPHADIREFIPPKGDKLHDWMRSRAKKAGCSISGSALRLLADLIGGNLWLSSREIDKLCLYAQGRSIEENDVTSLVSYAQETNIFAMTDAILERRSAAAIRLLHRLEDEGAQAPYLMVMITRQFRLVIQAKYLLRERRKAAEIGRALGISSDYVLRKTIDQAKEHSPERLEEIYRKLLDTDIAMKTGMLKGDKGELALDLLVSELCAAPS